MIVTLLGLGVLLLALQFWPRDRHVTWPEFWVRVNRLPEPIKHNGRGAA